MYWPCKSGLYGEKNNNKKTQQRINPEKPYSEG